MRFPTLASLQFYESEVVMMLSGFSISLLTDGRPKLEFDKPKISNDGQWLLSGKMIVEFTPGPSVPVSSQGYDNAKGLEIAVAFSDAANEQEAIFQAAKALRQIGSEIEQVASALLHERKQIP